MNLTNLRNQLDLEENLARPEQSLPAWVGAGIIGWLHPLCHGRYFFRSEPDQHGRSLFVSLTENDVQAAMPPEQLSTERTGVDRRVRLTIELE